MRGLAGGAAAGGGGCTASWGGRRPELARKKQHPCADYQRVDDEFVEGLVPLGLLLIRFDAG